MAFSKLFNGIANAVKGSDSKRRSSRSDSTIDKYHTSKCNKIDRDARIKISLLTEGPPIVMFGPPAESSGAPIHGALVLDVFPKTEDEQREELSERRTELDPVQSTMSLSQLSDDQLHLDYVELRSVKVWLIQVIRYGEPFVASSSTLQSCADCCREITELASWDVLNKRTAFAKGTSHSYPFGHLIPGDVPATAMLSNVNCSITYELVTKVTYVNDFKGTEDLINLSLPILLRRSILRGRDRNSLRIFPPTEVTGTASIPNVSYPRSTFPVEIRLDNVATKTRRWRMRKLNWRVEESALVETHHCKRHTSKYGLAVAFTERKQAGRTVAKNSGGVGNPNYNYFFEKPRRASLTRAHADQQLQEQIRLQEEREAADAQIDGGGIPHRQDSTPDLEPTSSTQPAAAAADDASPVAPTDSTRAESVASPTISRAVGTTLPVRHDSNAPDFTPFASSWSNNENQEYRMISETMTSDNARLEDPNQVVLVKQPAPPVLYVEEIRTLCSGSLKSGWKSDFSDKGRIEVNVEVNAMDLVSMGFNSSSNSISSITSQNCDSPLFDPFTYIDSDTNCSCDLNDHKHGIYVSHNLIVEAVVAEEVVQQSTYKAQGSSSGASRTMDAMFPVDTSNSRPIDPTDPDEPNGHHDGGTGPDALHGNKSDAANHISGIPTGVARVLRMQFKLCLTERGGVGVSWDDEVPPTYTKVGALSPPTYDQATSSNNTPLLSSMVIPLEDEQPEHHIDDLTTPPPRARVKGERLQSTMSELHI